MPGPGCPDAPRKPAAEPPGLIGCAQQAITALEEHADER